MRRSCLKIELCQMVGVGTRLWPFRDWKHAHQAHDGGSDDSDTWRRVIASRGQYWG